MPFLVSFALATTLFWPLKNNGLVVAADAIAAEPSVEEQRLEVDVTGSVRRPGLYTLPIGARVVDAVKAAGGPAPSAALDQVSLADPLQDGQTLQIPARQAADGGRVGAQVRQGHASIRAGLRSGPGRQVRTRERELSQAIRSSGRTGKIDLNSASASDLEQLPGVGPGLASRIIDYRSSHGRIRSIEELKEVSGIGDRRLERIAPLVEVR